MTKQSSFEIIAGTYEEFLLGYNYSSKEHKLTQSFAAHDHTSSVRSVTSSGAYLASGGADDRIFVYDLKTRKEHCSLIHHNATVNTLKFTESCSHLISASADGVLSIVRVGNWQLEKNWEKGHKGAAILDIALHSSGKMALTLGADCTLSTWNLVKGRQAYIINLNSKSANARSLERVLWGPDAVKFILFGGKSTDVWSIETGGILKQIGHEERVTSCAWLDDATILVGFEDGQVKVVNIEDDAQEAFKAHEARVKNIAVYKKYVVTCSSSGCIKVWNKSFEELASVESGCRITCLAIVPPMKVKKEEDVPVEVEIVEEAVPERRSKKARVTVIENNDDEETPKKKHKKKKRVCICKICNNQFIYENISMHTCMRRFDMNEFDFNLD